MSKKTTNKKNNFIKSVLVLISILIVVAISIYLLDTTGKINQGCFRINDLVTFSTADVQDTTVQTEDTSNTTDVKTQSLSNLKLNISQKNQISILVAKTGASEATGVYIDNFKINYPVLTDKMYIYQDENNKLDLKSGNIKLDLTKQDSDGQYLIKFNIDNSNCIKEAIIPETSEAIVYDGTIFNVLNTKISDIAFDIQFNLNIIDSNGRTNICKIKLHLPNELLVTNGVSIIKENTGDFPFVIK